MGVLAKPLMRGYLTKNIKFNVTGAFICGFVTSALWYYGVMVPRKEAYRNFYATYDPDKEFERMKAAGVFMGIPKEGEEEE